MELIIRKLGTLADPGALLRKHKAISALFPYAVWQERDKEHPILDVIMHALKITRSFKFWWPHFEPFTKVLLDGTSHISSKRALMLASPYIPWFWWRFGGVDLVRMWAVAASVVPKEEEIAPSVIDMLFKIAHSRLLSPPLYGDAWSWLTLRSALPPVCEGRDLGSRLHVVQMVRDLKDIEILKSYLLLIWSEWNSSRQFGSDAMRISTREDFSGIGMSSHRADLLQRLDHVLAQLDRESEQLQQDKPRLDGGDLQRMKCQYGELRETLLEVDREVLKILTRALSRLTTLFEPLTHVDTHRITFGVHMCTPSCLSIGSRLGCSILVSLHH